MRATLERRRAGAGSWGGRVARTIAFALTAAAYSLLVTAAAASAAGPTIMAYSPPADDPLSQHMSPHTKPWVKFSTQIDQATLAANFFLTKQGSAVKVPATYEVQGPPINIVKLAPSSPLEGGTVYQVTVAAGVRGVTGEALRTPWSWTFRVEPDRPPDTFLDVPPGSPYFEAIQGLYQADVVDGVIGPTGSSFLPDNPIWRQQFAKMIVGALALPVTEDMTSPFTDLGEDSPSSLYPHQYVAAVYANSITTGVTATRFAPYGEITRAQVVTMGVRALESLHPGLLAVPPPDFDNAWGAGFSPIHGPKARVAEYNGLLDGLGADAAHPAGAFEGLDPWGVMPRGEVAQFLWNVLGLLP